MLKRIKSMSVLVVLLMLLGCSHTSNGGHGTVASPKAPAAEDGYSREILRLKQVIAKNPRSQQAKIAHLKIARLYVDHNNYRRNYRSAHAHMQAYLKLAKGAADEQTHNWIAVLREIELLSEELEHRNQQLVQTQNKLKKTKQAKGTITRNHRQLVQQETQLREENNRLATSNQKLQQTIERLKRLDRRLEEKRRHLNN